MLRLVSNERAYLYPRKTKFWRGYIGVTLSVGRLVGLSVRHTLHQKIAEQTTSTFIREAQYPIGQPGESPLWCPDRETGG